MSTVTDRPKSAAATKPKAVLQSIGHYDLEKNIGEGNFAKVRLAKHTISGQQVAIKIIDKNKLDKATSKKLFREVRIMRLLNHKNVVKLYEVIDTPDELFLVMEYVSGGEIFDFLVAHGRMKEKEARKHFRQIVGAVAYCHSLHIIHRDLKAENLLLDENMNVKIAGSLTTYLDFGFSNQFSPGQKLNTCARVIAGKYQIPFYMSPDCEKLVKKLLVIEPAKRATLEQIMSDKWYTEGCESEPAQIISPTQTPVLTPDQHNAVLDELEELGLERTSVVKSINEGLYDSLTATYYLVADRRANGLPRSLTLSSATKANPTMKTSRATDLEILEEDEVAPGQVRQKSPSAVQSKTKPTTTAQSATTAAPPRVVSGRRRAATVTADVKEDLPPARPPVSQLARKQSVKDKDSDVTGTSPLPPIVNRARAQTMQTKPNEEEETVPIDQFKARLKLDEPRTARFTFSVSTTSTKDPLAVFEIVKKALEKGEVKFSTSGMVASCRMMDMEFEIEVCKLPNLQVVGLRCKRLAGDVWSYKELLSGLIDTMNL